MAIENKKAELKLLIDKITAADPFESVELSGKLSDLLLEIKAEESKTLQSIEKKPRRTPHWGLAHLTRKPVPKFGAANKKAFAKASRARISPKKITVKKI